MMRITVEKPAAGSTERHVSQPRTRWWPKASNPPCLPWCTGPHATEEYLDGGIICTRAPVASGRAWSVFVDAGQWSSDEHPERYELVVDVRLSNGTSSGLECIEPGDVPALCAALQRAAEICREVRR